MQHSPQINSHKGDAVGQKPAETDGRERSLYTTAPFSREDSEERDLGPPRLWTASRISPATTQHDFAFFLSTILILFPFLWNFFLNERKLWRSRRNVI